MNIKYINLFESQTGAKVLDCLAEDELFGFIVHEGDMGLAIGKGGKNIGKIKNKLKKNIVVVEYADKPKKFIENLFTPVKLKKIEFKEEDGKKKAIIMAARKDRGRILGPEGSKIKIARKLAQRHHNISHIQLQTS
ncbi:MAG: NusA-like transcription termination signal-binding factor [Candidatus Altiarchaeales archaeon]|nr:NusA-like transcription termination signal-binding factor [Candidatus Altiarchaeales archaeon]